MSLGTVLHRLTCPRPVPHLHNSAQRRGAPEFSGEMIGRVLRGFSVCSQWVLMATHEYSWVLMGSQWVLMSSHGFSVGTQAVHFGVLRGFSGRHPPLMPLLLTPQVEVLFSHAHRPLSPYDDQGDIEDQTKDMDIEWDVYHEPF